MRTLFIPLLASLVHGQWGNPFNCPMPTMPGCPTYQGGGWQPFPNFFPMPPMQPMPPMMPIVPQHVGNGMGGYVTSGKMANGGNYAAAGSYSSSNGNGPFRTVTYSTGPVTSGGTSGGGRPLPYRPTPPNTVHQESEKRTKLPNGGELITKTMVEKTPTGQRISSFSYSQNPSGPVIPNPGNRVLPTGKLPFAAKERLEQYKTPLEVGVEPDGDVYIREGSGEDPSSPSLPQLPQLPKMSQVASAFQSASSSGPGPAYSFMQTTGSQPAVAFASQSSSS